VIRIDLVLVVHLLAQLRIFNLASKAQSAETLNPMDSFINLEVVVHDVYLLIIRGVCALTMFVVESVLSTGISPGNVYPIVTKANLSGEK
jgi:hypothetical protein